MKISTLVDKEIIITGASGFIGSHLLKYLISKKLKVTGYYRNYSERFEKLGINGNVINIDSYNQIPSGNNKVLIHLAQESNIQNSEFINNSSDINLTKSLVNKNFFFMYIFLALLFMAINAKIH